MNGFFPEGWNTQVTDSKKAFTPAFLAEAQAKQTVLESTALMCDAAHNLIIDLGQIKGIIPREEGAIGIADGSTRDIALISRVGKPVCFAVTAIGNDENGRPCAVLSRRKAQQLCREYILTQKSEGYYKRQNHAYGVLRSILRYRLRKYSAAADRRDLRLANIPPARPLLHRSKYSCNNQKYCAGRKNHAFP